MADNRSLEVYRASEAAVDAALQNPIADQVISAFHIACFLDAPNQARGVWSLYIITTTNSALKIDIAGNLPTDNRDVPAGFTITDADPTECTKVFPPREPNIFFLPPRGGFFVQIEPLPASYTVKQFLQFLKDDGLLRYKRGFATHPGFWFYEVFFRLTIKRIVPGGSSYSIAQRIDKYNEELKELSSYGLRRLNDERHPYVNANVMADPGVFDP